MYIYTILDIAELMYFSTVILKLVKSRYWVVYDYYGRNDKWSNLNIDRKRFQINFEIKKIDTNKGLLFISSLISAILSSIYKSLFFI